MRNLPTTVAIQEEDLKIIDLFISTSIRVANISAITLVGRKVALIAHSLSYSEKVVNFLSDHLPIGIPRAVSTLNMENRNLSDDIHLLYDYCKIVQIEDIIFGFSVDNVQYAKYENHDVTSKKFNVPIVTIALNWIIKPRLKFDSTQSKFNPLEWRGNFSSISSTEIVSILSVDENFLDKAINSPCTFPFIEKDVITKSSNKEFTFALTIPWCTDRNNVFISNVFAKNPASD